MEEENPKQEQEPIKVIPSISLDENKVVIDTFEIPLIVDDKEISIKMRKLTAGERREIVKEAAPIKVVGKTAVGNIDSIGYVIGVLSTVIVEAPFPVTKEFISSLPATILDYLYEEYIVFAENKKKD